MKPWKDDVMRGVEYVHNLMDYMLGERNQLYGIAIYLMIRLGLEEAELPSIETFKTYEATYYMKVEKSDDGLYRIRLVPREEENDAQAEV